MEKITLDLYLQNVHGHYGKKYFKVIIKCKNRFQTENEAKEAGNLLLEIFRKQDLLGEE